MREKMICTECFEVLRPNKRNSVVFSDDCGISAICHSPPCGDGLNDDSSVLIEYDSSHECIIAEAKERISFWKAIAEDLGKDLDFSQELLIGNGKSTYAFKRFLIDKRKELGEVIK